MAQLYCRGAAHIFCAPYSSGGSIGTPLYFGTAENAPRITIRPAWEGVMNDLAGKKIPHDFSYQGQEGFITAHLTRWNESVYQLMADRTAQMSSSNGVPGTDAQGDIGSLLMTENLQIAVWVQFPYSAYAAFQNSANGAMPAGYRFVCAMLEGPDEPEIGTGPGKLMVNWHAWRMFNVSTGAYKLYDYNMSGLPAIN